MENIETTKVDMTENDQDLTECTAVEPATYGTTEIPNHRIIGIDTTKAKAFACGAGAGAGLVLAWLKGIPAIKRLRERRKALMEQKLAEAVAAAEETPKSTKPSTKKQQSED